MIMITIHRLCINIQYDCDSDTSLQLAWHHLDRFISRIRPNQAFSMMCFELVLESVSSA